MTKSSTPAAILLAASVLAPAVSAALVKAAPKTSGKMVSVYQ